MVPYGRNDICDYDSYGQMDQVVDSTRFLIIWTWPMDRTPLDAACELLIHADCWGIIERFIGPQAEDRLDITFQAMKDGWEKNSYGVEGLVVNGRWQGHRILHTTHQYRLIPVTEPTEVPALEKLIKKSMKAEPDSTTGEAPAGISPAPTVSTTSAANIPVEIKAMILNQLPEWSDVDNTLEAFSWDLPEFLWRDWFPHDLIFDELDGIPAYKIDWKILYTGVMRLLDGNSLAMMNRRRIVRAVKELREDFFELLDIECGRTENN
ncbi:hypothetical protein FQN54_004502 [Arachnomyces sp. PD_36]|nr:hypothetical protein FQN54_004502 [Arachnomyces sp. PD_36]